MLPPGFFISLSSGRALPSGRQMLANFIDVTRADRENDVAGFRGFTQRFLQFLKGREESRSLHLLRQGLRGDSDGVLLTGSIDPAASAG